MVDLGLKQTTLLDFALIYLLLATHLKIQGFKRVQSEVWHYGRVSDNPRSLKVHHS